MGMKNIKTIEKDGLILSEDGKIVMGVSDDFITNVVIPEGVEEIGEQAFSGCCSIKMVTFPSSLKKIGFASLAGISSCYLSIPEGVEVIENAAFFNATISCVSLPSTLKVLENAFVGCIIKNLFMFLVREMVRKHISRRILLTWMFMIFSKPSANSLI